MPSPIPRQVDATPLAQRLLEAGVVELREAGHDGLTVRSVARRAGVSAATAYKAFSSREHLLASIFLWYLEGLPDGGDDDRPLDVRLPAFVSGFAVGLAGQPELVAALRAVFLGGDGDSARVRDAVVAEFGRRFDQVCRDDLTGPARQTVLLAFAGAMLVAGAGLLDFADIGDHIGQVLGTVRP